MEESHSSYLISKISFLLVIQSSFCYNYRLMIFHKKKDDKKYGRAPNSRQQQGGERQGDSQGELDHILGGAGPGHQGQSHRVDHLANHS